MIWKAMEICTIVLMIHADKSKSKPVFAIEFKMAAIALISCKQDELRMRLSK